MELGTQIDDFTATAYNYQGDWQLSAFKDKKIILYFYPKDDTSGCTKEAIDFQNNKEEITQLNAVIIGVSPDSATSHEKFAKKFDLDFVLLADEDKSLCNRFGVWVEKSMYGKKYMGVERSSFIIENQTITHAWRKVKVNGHVDAIIAALNQA